MRRRRMKFRPSRKMIGFSRVFAGVFAVVGLGFAALGVTTLLPTAGLFGLVWTLMALAFMGMGIYGACNKDGLYFLYEFEIDEEGGQDSAPSSPSDAGTETRLTELKLLYDQRLITLEEYEEKRREILKEL